MNANSIIQLISKKHGVAAEDIKSHCRERQMVMARWHAWKIARKQGWSLSRIGREFDRDHTSIMHGLKEIRK